MVIIIARICGRVPGDSKHDRQPIKHTPEPEPTPGETALILLRARQRRGLRQRAIDHCGAGAGPEYPANKTNVICTWFGGSSDPNNSAYPPYGPLGSGNYVALPANVSDAAMRERGVRVRPQTQNQGPVADKGRG